MQQRTVYIYIFFALIFDPSMVELHNIFDLQHFPLCNHDDILKSYFSGDFNAGNQQTIRRTFWFHCMDLCFIMASLSTFSCSWVNLFCKASLCSVSSASSRLWCSLVEANICSHFPFHSSSSSACSWDNCNMYMVYTISGGLCVQSSHLRYKPQ